MLSPKKTAHVTLEEKDQTWGSNIEKEFKVQLEGSLKTAVTAVNCSNAQGKSGDIVIVKKVDSEQDAPFEILQRFAGATSKLIPVKSCDRYKKELII